VCFALSALGGVRLAGRTFSPDKPVGPVKPGIYEPVRGAYLGAALDTTQIGGDLWRSCTQM
jgi:hypothetical protein